MNRQALIIGVIVAVLIGTGIWFFYFRSPAPAPEVTTVISSNSDVQRIEQELANLRRLKDLQIDTSILKNPFLQSLEALSTPQTGTTTHPTPGRANPFLPF